MRSRNRLLRRALLILALIAASPVPALADAAEDWSRLTRDMWTASQEAREEDSVALAEQALTLARKAFGPRHRATLTSMNNLAMRFLSLGRYDEAEPLLTNALSLAQDILGDDHEDTLHTHNFLALLYQYQSRFADAEKLHRKILALRRETFGPRHPTTLQSMNNLAMLYESQGRFSEAETLYEEALPLIRDVIGESAPETLTTMNNLAVLYKSQGRLAEAESLFRETLDERRKVLDPRDPDIMQSMNNLAALYLLQGRHAEAEPLAQEALDLRRDVLGPFHPDTLQSIHNLAGLYENLGRHAEAEARYQEALDLGRRVFGRNHRWTLTSMNNLAHLYAVQGRHADAEVLYQDTLDLRRNALGPDHPDTLTSINNLAVLYDKQDRREMAEVLYQDMLPLFQKAFGPRHPTTIIVSLNAATNHIAQNHIQDALAILRNLEPVVLGWMGQELYDSAAESNKRLLVARQATYQDVILSLAAARHEKEAQSLAGTVILRWKNMQAEEGAYLARLARLSESPTVQRLAEDLERRRAALPPLARHGSPDVYTQALRHLEDAEQALVQESQTYKDQLKVRDTNLEDIQATLTTENAVLLDFRRYHREDFLTGGTVEDRWGALLLNGSNPPVFKDLGPAAKVDARVKALLTNMDGAEDAARALYQTLIQPFEDEFHAGNRIYVAPDGTLTLLPFTRLVNGNGQTLGSTHTLRMILTGRDLIRSSFENRTEGLLALGGIDFNVTAGESTEVLRTRTPDTPGAAELESGRITTLAAEVRAAHDGEFAVLQHSGLEVDKIAALYRVLRPGQPVTVWKNTDASEYRLKNYVPPPRVLHLATHGFYLPELPQDRLLVMSGVSLSGANRGLKGETTNGEDGILYAIEAQTLNLEGTDLVVLSACKTAQGAIDQAEGVYGLVRALRIAGARQVLVTLWPIKDRSAQDFMSYFYKVLLSDPAEHADAALALETTRREAMDRGWTPKHWAPYVLFGG